MSDVKVLIAVPTQEMARRADFYDYFNMIERPANTVVTFSHGQSPARNRNIMIEQAQLHKCTHILFIDDDCMVRPNILKQLLAHDVDMVSGLYLMRNYPHLPIMFDIAYADGRCRYQFLNDGKSGLVPAIAAGLGACLIKVSVFNKLEKPYIRLGELEKDHWCDDISFFLRCKEAGIQLFVDLDCPVGHVTNVIIWPNKKDDGKWYTAFNSNGTGIVETPQQVPTEAEVKQALEAAGVAP